MIKKFSQHLQEILATALYTGYIPFMPGTFGTIVGVVIYIFLSRYTVFYYPLLVLLVIIAVVVSDYAEKHIFKVKDPKHVVIDEVVGFLISMVSFQFNWSLESLKYLLIGFVVFRVLDIWKPYPIRQTQVLEGGLGIVIDDVLAGVYTNLFLQFLRINGSFFNL